MEDDKIKALFGSFRPQLTPDPQFLSKLRQNMEAVDVLKRQVAVQRRKNRIAVVVAAVLGFLSGGVMTLLTPAIGAWLSTIRIPLPTPGLSTVTFNGPILAWMMTAAISGLIAYNAYQVTVTRLTARARSL